MKFFEKLRVGELVEKGTVKQGDATVTVLRKDASGNAVEAACTTVPNAKAGYAVGCRLTKTDAANGQCATWINLGTVASCAFRPVGPVLGYGVAMAAGAVACSNGVTAFTTALPEIRREDIGFVQYVVSDDTDNILAAITADGSIGATLSADPLVAHSVVVAALRNQCVPMYDIFAAGKHTTVGGDTVEDITVTGVQAGDLVLATFSVSNDSDTIVKAAYQAADTVRVTLSADPLTAHEISYEVLRPRGSFKPSHYVFAAGVHTTVGGAAAEAIAITGLLATDIPIVGYNTTDDTDTIAKAVPTAGTLTVTMSADPGATHKLAYQVLRAY